MNTGKKAIRAIVQLAILLATTCGLTTGEREQVILNHYTDNNRDRYADLLVDESKYTTSGVEYHRKFFKHLIGIAGDIVEVKKLSVEKGTIGFYFDKKSGDRDRLYIGLDINTNANYGQPFETVAISLVRRNLRDIVQTFNSCRSIFSERKVMGMVIGWVWHSGSAAERVSVWIFKEDFIRFEDGMITFDELVLRSTVTNTAGRVIKLPL